MKYVKGLDEIMFWRDDRDEGKEYRRVVGGLAWPWGELPGWLVIMGEERRKREDGKRHINLLHAWAARDGRGALAAREIMHEATALSVKFICNTWASPASLPDAALLAEYNRGLGRHDRKLALRTPPQWEARNAFLVYDRLHDNRTRREHTLHLSGSKALADEFAVLRPINKAERLEDYPAVAAALYALAWLELTPYRGQGPAGRKNYEAPTTAGY